MILAFLLILLTEAQHATQIAEELKGKTEVVLWDRTRVDILTKEYAYEVDWASKWAESIGQSLYYAELTGRKPGIILLSKKTEGRFIYRAQTVCAKHNIKLIVRWIE
jgi:hypothetical protein